MINLIGNVIGYYSSPLEALPDYESLSNLELYVDYSGLAVGTTNDYGVVDGSGNVTTLKSLSPGPTGRDFTAGGTGVTLNGAILFDGNGQLTNTTKANWNFLHYNAGGATSIKHTIHIVAKLGNAINPNTFYGIFGNTGNSSASKGFYLGFDDRIASNLKDLLVHSIVRGTSSQFISHVTEGNIALTNRWAVYTFETDISQSLAKCKIYVNGELIGYVINYVNNTSPQITSTYDLQIGAGGNAVGRLVGGVKEIVVQSTVDTAQVRSAFITALIAKHGISTTNDQVFNVIQRLSGESRYYLATVLGQNPTDSNTMLACFADGTTHVYEAGKKISMMKSTDKGLTYSAKVEVYNPADAEAIQDISGGYDSNGRFHLFTNIITSGSTGAEASHRYVHLWTDDDGDTWDNDDITSIMPADGMGFSQSVGRMIENDGVLMSAIYRFDDIGDLDPTALYVLRSTDYGANWTVITVHASNATQRTECAIIGLSDTDLIIIARDEVTNEYHQYASDDNGLTWASSGALTFGETFGRPGPCTLEKFQINGSYVIACYYPDRNNNRLKAVYATPANLIASGVSGWDTDTKTYIKQANQTGGYHLHYGSVVHYDNDINAVAMYPYDQFPGDGSGLVNELWFVKMPTWHYDTVKTQLGL